VAAICELVNDNGSMMRLPQLIRFATTGRSVALYLRIPPGPARSHPIADAQR
jgi:hypothetical protein